MRAALVATLAILLMLFAIESVPAQPRLRGAAARIQRVAPAPAYDGYDDGYFAKYITGPGGARMPIRDYPGSASVVTRKMMDDFQSNSLCDALRFTPGVTVGGC